MNIQTKTDLAPIEKSITVKASAEAAFDFYVSQFDAWWPKETHSISGSNDNITPAKVLIEPYVGGVIKEVRPDGSEQSWGVVEVFEPGKRLTHSWQFARAEGERTTVDIRFTDNGDGTTTIDLTHSDWENWPDGAQQRPSYADGWEFVLGKCYVEGLTT